MSNSESDPLLSNGPRVGTYSSSDVPTPSIELPISFQLFDISEDNKFLALIDTNLMLQVYELNTFAQTMRNIPCLTRSEHMSCIYISVASKTGHVAVSLLNMDTSGETFKEDSEFDKFAKFKLHRRNGSEEEQGQYLDRMNNTCRIYRGNEDGTLEKPFQGRAVFTKNRMVLIGRWTLDVYHTESLQKMYSFKPGSFYLDSYISFHHSRCYQIQNWYRSYFLGGEFADVSNTGYGLANISEHVRKNIIVVYDEDCSFYRRTSVKIWSISTGSLICSFMRNYGEYVISVSEDHSFLVTNDPRNSTLNIYCMKSGTRLHIYKPQGHKDYPGESTIMFVKLLARQNYMLIMGTTVKKSDRSNKTGSLFFEIFSIEQKAKVKYIETSTSISPNSMLALGIFQNEDFLNNPSQFHGVFWETANNGDRYLYFRTFSPNLHTNDPASNGLSKNRLWDTFDYTYIGTEEERGFKREWDIASYISRYTTIFYLFEKDSQKYVLLISPYVVQLWKLEIAANDSEIQTDTIIFFNNISRETKCYLDFSNSALIYTRSYYGLNYIYTLIGDDMKLEIEDKYDYQMPHVHFLGHKGHIFVYVESKCGSSISEEIILPLPLPEPQTETTSDSLCKIAHNNDDATDKVPEDNFYDIESCLLALLYAYWMHDKAFGRLNPYNIAVLRKTEDFLKSIILLNGNPAYFQTMSACKILTRLVHFDKGLELISDFILQKELPIAIYNFPIGDNENLLAALIQRRKLDLFQLQFNQAIINYYNGDSVNLLPLMDALLCLQKNQLPDILSYLPANLENTGLSQWECNTLGDQKSFNNFTAFHQMKKRKSSILNLIRLRTTKVKEKGIGGPEIYFDSSEICLIPLPTLRVYDAISYSLLSKNTSDSRIDALNEMLEYESPVIEVLLTYRWRNYIKKEIFNYKPGVPIRNPSHLICLAITFLTWILFLLQEIRQMVTLKWNYWKSTYNYIDLLAATLPLVTFILLITNDPYLYEISSLAALTLWFQFILRLRANRRMGILIEIVIQLGVKIAPVIGLMILLIFAFTHSFAILLRMHDDSFFQEQFEGNVAPNENSVGANIALRDQSQQNLFKDGFLAFTTVWFFLYGIFDPIFSGDVGNYPMALVLAILFSFITALVILNVVIAIMTGAIDETEKKGNRNWHIHLADVSTEVEQLWPWPIEEDSAKYIYYRAKRSTVEVHHEKIKIETKKLRERLLKRRGRGKPL